MWKQELEVLLKVWPENIPIKKLEAVYDGIAVTDASDNHWFYNRHGGTLTERPYWKKGVQNA